MKNLQLNDESARLLWQIRCKLALVEPDLAGACRLIDEALDELIGEHQTQAKQAAATTKGDRS